MTRQNSKTTPLKAQPTMRASKATVDTTIATQPSKLDILLDILRRKDGASIAELAAATDRAAAGRVAAATVAAPATLIIEPQGHLTRLPARLSLRL